jgi:hypothetical protein
MSAVWNAVLGTLFTWGVTAAGAALVFVFPTYVSIDVARKLVGLVLIRCLIF